MARLEDAMDVFGVARVEALAELEGNPLDLRIERFGRVVAPAALAAPELDFANRITGFRAADADRLPGILDHYGALGIRPWLELVPTAEVALPAQTEVQWSRAVLYGKPRSVEPAVAVRETDDAAAVGRLLLAGSGVPADIVERHGPALGTAAERSGGRFFVVEAEGKAAAGAILTVDERVGYLAQAATLPGFRRRGFQSALLAARIEAASTAGCEIVTATAELLSGSQRNIARAGLRLAYTKPVLRFTPVAQRRGEIAQGHEAP